MKEADEKVSEADERVRSVLKQTDEEELAADQSPCQGATHDPPQEADRGSRPPADIQGVH